MYIHQHLFLLFAQEGYQQNNIKRANLSDTIKINLLHTAAIEFYHDGEYSKSERFLEDALRLTDSVILKKEIPFNINQKEVVVKIDIENKVNICLPDEDDQVKNN